MTPNPYLIGTLLALLALAAIAATLYAFARRKRTLPTRLHGEAAQGETRAGLVANPFAPPAKGNDNE